MKKYNYLIITLVLILAGLFLTANLCFEDDDANSGRPYRVEINRLCTEMEEGGEPDLSGYSFVTKVTEYNGQADFYNQNSDYMIQTVNSKLYRFDYSNTHRSFMRSRLVMNISLFIAAALLIAVLVFIRIKLIKPFNRFSSVPYDLSKGNLSAPLEENKSRYFGKFVWGVNMLRENIIDQKQNELELLKEKQTLVLSISHDIRTPLSAIKLYAKGLSKGIYNSEEKIRDAAEHIDSNADDIDAFVTQLTRSASENLIKLDVKPSEYYVSELIEVIAKNYTSRLADNSTEFSIGEYRNCIISGDLERSIEVLQNLVENAIKYGDGKYIKLSFSYEEDCILMSVINSGCSLSDAEIIHIFDSFWRGSNAVNKPGSGLGLYICRELMLKMDGEIFAHKNDDEMCVTAVFRKA